MKNLLILKAGDDVPQAEVLNIASQATLFGIEVSIENVDTKEQLSQVLYSGKSYDYIYLATHGCSSSWGNVSGTIAVTWIEFAADVCKSGISNPGAIFMHSCCRGGLNEVAYDMFACCNKIDFVCGPRSSANTIELAMAFSTFLYCIEYRRLDPIRAADKVVAGTEVRLVCFDRLECTSSGDYREHCRIAQPRIDAAFDSNPSQTPMLEAVIATPVFPEMATTAE